MKVFITGSTGAIGSRVAEQLVKEGHTVSALVRDLAKAAPLKEKGVRLVNGTLDTLDIIREEASKADGMVSFPRVPCFSAKRSLLQCWTT